MRWRMQLRQRRVQRLKHEGEPSIGVAPLRCLHEPPFFWLNSGTSRSIQTLITMREVAYVLQTEVDDSGAHTRLCKPRASLERG